MVIVPNAAALRSVLEAPAKCGVLNRLRISKRICADMPFPNAVSFVKTASVFLENAYRQLSEFRVALPKLPAPGFAYPAGFK